MIFKNPVSSSQETQDVSIRKTNRLMLFGDTIAVRFDNFTKRLNTICTQYSDFLNVKAGGTYK
jgi:hypothetical protein